MERYVNGLINLQNSIQQIFRDIKIAKDDSDHFWPNPDILSTASPDVIAFYVVTKLGKLIYGDEHKIPQTFQSWIPGAANDPIEKEIFNMYQDKPFDYWIHMLDTKQWKFLSQIALRIISIPPTETACERVFSARREIMTKHISNIHDTVVEARAHFKAGLYQQQKQH